MLKLFRIFASAKGTNPWLVVTCLILASVAEIMSMSAMLPALLAVSGESGVLPPGFKVVIDATLAVTGLPATIAGFTVAVVLMLILRTIMLGLALTYAGFSIANVSTRLREDLLNAMFDTKWRYFVDHRAGRIANTISVDATRAGHAYLESAKFVSAVIQGVGYLAFAMMASFKFAVAGAIAGAIIVLGMGKLIAVSRRAGKRQTRSTSQLVTLVADALNNIKPIKSMARTVPFIAMFGTNLQALNKSIKLQVLSSQGVDRGNDVLISVMIGAGFFLAVGVWEMTLASVTVVGIIAFQSISVVRRLQKFLQRGAELEASYHAVHDMSEKLTREAERAGGAQDITLDDGCTFNHVTFAHEDQPTVENVSLFIPSGKITVLQGPSGAGKTTIVDLLLGLHEPASGHITIDDRPLNQLSLKAWRSHIGYVPQELSLLHASLRDNIALGNNDLSDEDIVEALRLADAEDFVNSLPDGLDSNAGEMGGRLSGGQRQRIALARALVGRPKLLILDEVTSALDPETEASICSNALDLAGEFTIIAITHRPAWSKIADRLYKVDNGAAAEIKAPAKRRRKTAETPAHE
ncbi:MAG: ABC transporter ATP-binding protein [Anderseniella sp.]